jgi:cytochrome b6-f complex iron-sulfur subunit
MQTRREFCGGLCLAAAAGGALAIPGCGGGGGGTGTSPSGGTPTGTSAPSLNRLTGTVAGNQVSLQIAAGSALAATGGQALVQAGSTTLLVARTGAATFTALTAICTHEACVITNGDGSAFVCPCHGSRFDTSGRVLTGPAVQALRSFPTAFAGSSLTITI